MTGSRRTYRRRAAWLVPAATAAVVAGAVAVPVAAAAGTPDLPDTTPEALIAAVGSADVTALSGKVVETANLGLPALPGDAGGAALNWQTLLTGTHTANVAIDGPDRQRVALLGTLAESEVVHDGTDVWTYESGSGAVTHVVLPGRDRADGSGRSETPGGTPLDHAPMAMTPPEAAKKLLAAVTPTTEVTVGPATTVAGRDAYTLVLRPKQQASTIGRVVLAIDATKHLPLRVQIFAAGDEAKPAFETGFAAISYDRPSPSTFRFTPPAGSTVTTRQLEGGMHPSAGGDRSSGSAAAPATAQGAPKVIGTGWTSVLELAPGPDALASLFGGANGATGDRSSSAMLDRLFVRQPNGDRLFRSALFDVLLTADGRVFAGAVAPDVLQRAAATR